MPFVDRVDAGRRLAERLRSFQGEDVVVLGLPRGGVPVAFEVACSLGAPLDVIVVRKLGVPFQPELAKGAVGGDGALVLNKRVLALAQVSERELAEAQRREQAEVRHRARHFRRDRPRLSLAGRTVIIVDDGIATGATARAACQVAGVQGAKRVVLAVPVCPPDARDRLAADLDELVYVEAPEWFSAVGEAYLNFGPTSDQQVIDLLRRARRAVAAEPAAAPAPVAMATADPDPPPRDEEVTVTAGQVHLGGHLSVPEQPRGVVVFVHGSGSSRHSPRNRSVAEVLQHSGLAMLLFDLLTTSEESNRGNVFDIELLSSRLTEVSRWVRDQPECHGLPVGYFGASTGAAAALCAAAAPDTQVAAVVSRGGRPDLAGPWLSRVPAPTLLIVGGHDELVLDLNRQAQARLRCENRLAVVPGATHLFEEPGTLRRAATLAADWFVEHLTRTRQPSV